MNQDDINPLIETGKTETEYYSIGLLKLGVSAGEEYADPAGSGTLVSIGSAEGIVTAAHVLDNLPDHGKIGIVRFTPTPRFAVKETIDMSLAEKLTICSGSYGPDGPDIGFLLLSPEDVGRLKARCSFLNLAKRQAALHELLQRPGPYFDGLSGMVAEWTGDLPDERQLRVMAFRGLFGVGLVVGDHTIDGFDLLDFETTYGPETVSPDSYEGMSGAGLWRIYCRDKGEEQYGFIEATMIGVVFHQSEKSDNKRIIRCHGPESLYHLIEAVQGKWSG